MGNPEGSVGARWLVPRSHGPHVDRGRLGELLCRDVTRGLGSSLFQGADRAGRSRRCADVHQPGIQEPRLRPRPRSLYLFGWCKIRTTYLQSLGRGATFREISKRIVESIELPLPPMQRQHRFRSRLMSLMSIHRARIQSAQRIADLFGVLLGRAFSGSLTASWREAHMDEILQENGYHRLRRRKLV